MAFNLYRFYFLGTMLILSKITKFASQIESLKILLMNRQNYIPSSPN